MLEIKSSLDWSKVESEIRKLGNLMPIFNSDVKKFITHINSMVRDLSKLEVEARTRKSQSYARQCEELVNKINAEIKQIEKIHLMSMLSR